MEPDDSLLRAEVREPSSAAEVRVTEAIQSGVPDVVDVEGHLFGSEPTIDGDVPLEMRTRTNIAKRESGLKDAGVVRWIACSIQLPRDCQLMDSISLSDLLDQSMVSSIWVGFHIFDSFAIGFGSAYDLS